MREPPLPRIFIDTEELVAMAGGLQADAAELGATVLALTGAWARTPGPPVQLVALGARSGWTQARLAGLAAQLGAASASLRVEAVAAELGEIDERLYDLVTEGGRPFAEGVLDLLEGELPDEWLELLGLAMAGGAGAFVSLVGDGVGTLKDALDVVKTVKDFGGLGAEVGSVVPKLTPLARFLGVAGVGLSAYDAVAGWDNIWKREKVDRGASIEAAQDSAQVLGSGLMAIGGTVMLLPVPGAAQAVGGAMFIAGGGLKLASSAVDGYYYLRQHSAEMWNDARAGWEATTEFVGNAADGAINGAKHALGGIAGGGKKLFGLLPP